MIIRIVRMTFHENNIEQFQEVFNESKPYILQMNGCTHLELWRDIHEPNVFVTYSHWISEDALNAYRSTEFFKQVWKRTKALFNAKPEAYSVVRYV